MLYASLKLRDRSGSTVVQTSFSPIALPPQWRVRLPRAVEAALAAVVAVQLARLLWLALLPPAPFGSADPVIVPAVAALAGSLDPFHRDATAATASADVSGLKLFGVRSAGGAGSAILARADGTQAAFVVGDTIQPGVTLSAVAADHAVLLVDGAPRRLDFSVTAAPTAPGGLPSSLPAAAAGAAGTGVDPQRLLAQAGLRPVVEGGRTSGYSVIPRGDGALLRQVGLQSGDVLLTVNGQSLTPERYQSLAQDLAGQSQITITYRRGGEIRTATAQAARP